jgi:hypothetical protein
MKHNTTLLMLALALFAFCGGAGAQQKHAVASWRYHSENTIGLINGQSGSSLQALTVNGVQHGHWFAGIGTGLDLYMRRSIPVFAQINRTLGNHFFVYTAGGVNYYWRQNTDAKQFYMNDKMVSGFYGEVGAGYKINLHRNMALLISGAYSVKNLTEEGFNYYDSMILNYYTTGLQNNSAGNEKINYHLNRLVIKAGIAF